MRVIDGPLPLTVELVPGETATSLASRLARRNGTPRLVTFCSDLGIDYSGLANGAASEVERLASLAGCDADTLKFWTPEVVDKGWFRFGFEELKFTCFSRTRTRACPRCIEEETERLGPIGPAHLGLWQLSSIRSCHKHGCLLVALPTAERNKDTFDYSRLLDVYEPSVPVPVSKKALKLETWLARRIHRRPQSGWFDSLPLHVATQTCENLGALLTLGPQVRRSTITHEQWFRAGGAGYEVLKQGPEAMCQTLKSIQLKTPADVAQYRVRHRIFFNWVRDRNGDPAFDVIRDIVREFVWPNYPVAAGSIVLGLPCPQQKVHTAATATETFGVSRWKIEQRLVTLGHARKIKGLVHPVLPDYPSTKVVCAIASEIRGLINARGASAMLGIEPPTFRLLVNANLIQPAIKFGSNAPYYNGTEVTAFLARLTDLLKPKLSKQEDAVPLAVAASRWQCPLAEVIKMILVKRLDLHAVRPQTVKLGDLKVSIQAIRRAAANQTNSALSLAEAAIALETDTKTIRSLLNLELLEKLSPFEDMAHQRWRIVDAESVKQFSTSHISLKALAGTRNRDPANFSKELYGKGICRYQLTKSANGFSGDVKFCNKPVYEHSSQLYAGFSLP